MSAVAQALERGRTDVGTAEAGRQLPPNLAGGGMLASYQRTSALDGGPVQFVDNQHQDALRLRAGHHQTVARHRIPGQAETAGEFTGHTIALTRA